MDGINQVQVNNKADMIFANALRSILRQDPDIIMIGEIRDNETADIAVKAAITGHLVVSTLHTNSTASTITRLIDMGLESYLIADSVVGIIAQRLVRRLCTCKEERPATEEEKRQLGVPIDKELEICEPVGCNRCNGAGYLGRIGIYEIMPITTKIRHVIVSGGDADQIKQAAIEEGMSTLKASAAYYVKEGITSFSEMMKVAYESE
jgi:type IV pilus assembly protein PilB